MGVYVISSHGGLCPGSGVSHVLLSFPSSSQCVTLFPRFTHSVSMHHMVRITSILAERGLLGVPELVG